MSGNLSSLYQQIPPRSTAYDYDNPGPPFSAASIAAIDSIKEFLSANELAQARRLETVYYNSLLKDGVGTFIPGLREYRTSLCFYVGRYNTSRYRNSFDDFIEKVYAGILEADRGKDHWSWFRVTTPDGRRSYPVEVHGNLQAWRDRMLKVAEELGTTLAWFDRGKFCLADGRRFAFGDLKIDRAEGGKPFPKDW